VTTGDEVAALRRRLERERRTRQDAEAIAGRGISEALQRGRVLDVLRGVATAANAGRSADEAVEAALRGLCEQGAWDSGRAWRVAYGGGLEGIGQLTLGPLPEQSRFERVAPAASPLASRALAERRPAWEEDAATGRCFALALPVLAGAALLAVLEFRRPDARPPAPGFLDLAEQAALQVGFALQRAQAHEQLREALARLDAAVSNMSQGLCLFDPERRLVLANRRYGEMHGIALVGARWRGCSTRPWRRARPAGASPWLTAAFSRCASRARPMAAP
jgi:PAS domain-containing protein